jgi:hypothetical protein
MGESGSNKNVLQTAIVGGYDFIKKTHIYHARDPASAKYFSRKPLTGVSHISEPHDDIYSPN